MDDSECRSNVATLKQVQIDAPVAAGEATSRPKRVAQKSFFDFQRSFDSSIMATLVLIKESIGSLNDRSGSSVYAINKWIESEKKVRERLDSY